MYNAAVWLANVREVSGKDIDIDWQPFSLAQVNSDKGSDVKLWEQPEHLDGSNPALLAHRAGLSAKRQGSTAVSGVRILLWQSIFSVRQWTGEEPSLESLEAAVDEILAPAAGTV